MKKKLLGIGTVALILTLLLTLASACGNGDEPMTVASSDTGTLCAGYTTTNPVADPLNVASYGGIWASAVAVDTTDLISAWWYDDNLVPDAAWLSSADPREGIHEEDQWRLFKEDFTIPAGHVVTSASLRFTADNAVAVYLNGVLIATTPQGPAGYEDLVYGPSPYDAFDPRVSETLYTANFAPQEGSNTLMFVVRNWGWPNGPNPTGLLYSVEIELANAG